LALDGASWRFLTPLFRDGKLPHLARMKESGVWAELKTLEPTVSPAIWTTIATGFLPKRHGVLGFEGVPGKTMTTLPNSRMRRVKAYWNILADLGVTTGILGWWVSWPAENLGEGSYLVSDRVPYTRMEAAIRRATITSEDTFPPDLIEIVAPLVERPDAIDPEVVARFLDFDRAEMKARLLEAEYRMGSYLPEFKFAYQSDRSTWKMAQELFAERPVDAAAVYFTGIDTVSHLFWHFTFPAEFPRHRISGEDVARFGNVIPLYYEQIDDYLGRLLDVMGWDTTVIVVSDHGFGGTGDLPWSGGHGRLTPGAPIAPKGVLILSGPGIAGGDTELSRAHVLDLAPTILHLMGLPAAQDMLGEVLVEALAPPGRHELPRVASYEVIGRIRAPETVPVDPAGDAERLERLKALGYIQ
jgi:predicted AlkP superfamily phosphohydrolase/phosphomutase